MLIQAPQREYRTWIFDSRRWQHYRPRPDDIVIATYPKCGTTWMQRIVSLLVFQSPEPKPITEISAWIDRRWPQPIEAVIAQIEAQEHRRFLKSHLPLDGLPFYDDIKYVHVARDGEALIPNLAPLFKNRSQTFFFKATNGRWRGVVAEADLALYEAKVRAMLSPDCARWVAGGREQAWDPGQGDRANDSQQSNNCAS